ncbi:MAG: hypothetical protein JNL88_06290 [Bacteroidia bacterium]|nr:hypothetical protein [Bacteroidia bacterium]
MSTFRKFVFLIALPAFLSLLSSCYYDSVEELDPNFGQSGNCDTTGIISFSQKVQPILTTFCGTTGNAASSCHGSNSSSGLPLQSHAEVVAAVSLKLMDAIRHENGASAMPKGGGRLDNCRIATIQKWIDEGTLNN